MSFLRPCVVKQHKTPKLQTLLTLVYDFQGVKRKRAGSTPKIQRKIGGPRIQRVASSDEESDADSPAQNSKKAKRPSVSPTKLAAFKHTEKEEKENGTGRTSYICA